MEERTNGEMEQHDAAAHSNNQRQMKHKMIDF
jgi:hypothetical protein